MSCPYASVTAHRETPRRAAIIRLGGNATPSGSRPSLIAARMAAATRMYSGPGLTADGSSSASQAKLVCVPAMSLDRSRTRTAPRVVSVCIAYPQEFEQL